MLTSKTFKISFISTIIFIMTLLLFLITDYNTKNNNFRNSPSILEVQNIDSEHLKIELFGGNFEISSLSSNTNKNYRLVIRALLPKRLKILESFIYLSYAISNDIIQNQKNLDYIKNTQTN